LTKCNNSVIQEKEKGEMKNRIIIYIFIVLFGSLFLFGQSLVFAQDPLKDIISKRFQKEKDICPVVKSAILEGQGSRDVTKTSILLGHDACLVIRCAIEAKGQVDQVMAGAMEAGTTSDVCSRCAIDAGADPAAVARALESGFGHLPPIAAAPEAIDTGFPGGNNSGAKMSPSGF
jgi:hypothetical protein